MCAELLLKIYQLGYAKVEEYREGNGVKCGIHPPLRGDFLFFIREKFPNGTQVNVIFMGDLVGIS